VRILHVVGKLDRGGAETWLVQTLRHIDRSKYQFDFLVHTEKPGAYDDGVRALGSRIIPCLAPNNPVRYARNFLRILKEYGPYDCVHSHVHHFSGYVMALAKLGSVPTRIAHSHTAHLELTAPFTRKAYLRSMELLVRSFASNGIAVSGEAGDSLFPGGWRNDQRWRLQPIGIDIERLRSAKNRETVRRQINLSETDFVVGHVGRFVEAKNHRFFVDVASEVARLRPDAKFLLIGDGPLRGEIENLVSTCGLTKKFFFMGVRADVPDLLQSMDVFLFPSLYEGLPLALLEAQAAGLACVASNNVSPEANAGNIKQLSLNDSAGTWAKALLEHRSIKDNSRNRMDKYSIERSVLQLSQFYSGEVRPPKSASTHSRGVSA
jgi:glycosyltransferase involved in cell wall biosynthesis